MALLGSPRSMSVWVSDFIERTRECGIEVSRRVSKQALNRRVPWRTAALDSHSLLKLDVWWHVTCGGKLPTPPPPSSLLRPLHNGGGVGEDFSLFCITGSETRVPAQSESKSISCYDKWTRGNENKIFMYLVVFSISISYDVELISSMVYVIFHSLLSGMKRTWNKRPISNVSDADLLNKRNTPISKIKTFNSSMQTLEEQCTVAWTLSILKELCRKFYQNSDRRNCHQWVKHKNNQSIR